MPTPLLLGAASIKHTKNGGEGTKGISRTLVVEAHQSGEPHRQNDKIEPFSEV
jgi:hypothetical protein